MRQVLALLALFALASCGWNSATRLIPVSERVIPELTGEYLFEGYSVTYGRRLAGGLAELRITDSDGETTMETVAFDHLRTIEDDYEREMFYLVEVDRSSPDRGPRFNYDLFTVTQFKNDGVLEPQRYVSQYSLACARASDRFDNNPESECEFSRYSDVMRAIDDVFAWMDDPRIPLRYESGSQPQQ